MSYLEAALARLRASAVAVGTVVGDRTAVLCRGSLAGALVRERTVFYGASLTKQFIGVAATSAISAGSVLVHDAVTRWLPALPRSMKSVRLDHLAHHTSGLPDLCDPALGVPGGNAEVLERFRRSTTPPAALGARFAYNNAGYVLLAEVLAGAAGLPIDQVVGHLVAPLALSDTRFGGAAIRLEGHRDPPGTIGDGGVWTSIRDLMRWLDACNDGALGTDVVRLAETGTTLLDRTPVNYGWGVRVTETPAYRVVSHGGSWGPWLAKTVRIPERKVAVGILSCGAVEDEVSRIGSDLALALADDVHH